MEKTQAGHQKPGSHPKTVRWLCDPTKVVARSDTLSSSWKGISLTTHTTQKCFKDKKMRWKALECILNKHKSSLLLAQRWPGQQDYRIAEVSGSLEVRWSSSYSGSRPLKLSPCVSWRKVQSYQFLKKLRTSKPLILRMKTETHENVTFLDLRVIRGKAGPAQGFPSPSMPLPLYHSTGLGRKMVT